MIRLLGFPLGHLHWRFAWNEQTALCVVVWCPWEKLQPEAIKTENLTGRSVLQTPPGGAYVELGYSNVP